MLSKLVDRLLAEEVLRDEFARDPSRVLRLFEVSERELRQLTEHDPADADGDFEPELRARLLDLRAVGMVDRSHPGSEGARIERVEPSVVRAGTPFDIEVRLALGPQIDPSQAAPRALRLRLEHEGRAAVEVAAAPEVVHIDRRFLGTVFRGVRVAQPGRHVVRIGFEGAAIPEVVWARRLRVEEHD